MTVRLRAFFRGVLKRLDVECKHDWKVIYTDDDQCQHCQAIRRWPGGSIILVARNGGR